ncbi:Uncharacterized protein BM_BM4983 [Brugia malayi]|uniref:Bm4983, isoform a n=3 Tax=Brugia TaxID=6278 RepID=A0A0H5S9W7_BRUMA|nr:Uncharacterized protein BM_BM4983 [Brugia malayi]CRZ25159.1 Bm4983, isoform a [Brugia malayi]VDO33228.1 unnamed protein product [Brugia timori]VIO98852.1 Uncharacterized protein BM_BM4983 [Brugia malayi]
MIILVLLLKATALAHMNIAKVDSFDYFELTLIYPTSVCHAYGGATKFIVKKTIDNFCKVPADAASWTIHGLWPQRNDGSFPQFCGSDTKKFVLSKLLPIKQKLEKYWPNLFVMRSVSSLWKHEWEKHGTCAEIVEEVSDELKYFSKSLALYKQFDIFGILEKQEIIPSQEKLYDRLLLHQSLRSAYGKNVEFHCLQDKQTKSWLLADVRLCLTKNFQLMDCKKKPLKWKNLKRSLSLTYQPCPADDIVYLPFNNAHSVVSNSAIILILFSLLYSMWNCFHFQILIF